MTNQDLPDDPKEWPSDPFAILGVQRGIPEQDVRRAYTKLIRRFKPEHFPEQFRLIREAYETCKIQTHWYASDVRTESEPEAIRVTISEPTEDQAKRPEPGSEPEAIRASDSETNQEPEKEPERPAEQFERPLVVEPLDRPVDRVKPRTAAPPNEGERLWAVATNGGLFEAYTGLAELARTRPELGDVSLRLYWLLAVNPELDSAHSRHDWLAAALKQSRLTGIAAELFRRELDADSWVGVKDSYRDLLSTDAEPQDMLRLARWRVAACGRSGGWQATTADLDVLRRVLPFHDEPAWLSLLVFIYDWIAWTQVQPVLDLCREELARLRHLELSHSYAFDRIEATELAMKVWEAAEAEFLPRELLALLPWGWAGPEYLWPDAIRNAVSVVAEHPKRMLRKLDRFQEAHGLGLTLSLTRMLERFHRDHGRGREPGFAPDVLRGVVRVIVKRHERVRYAALRKDVLQDLIAEAIDPEELVAACLAHPSREVRWFARHVAEDAALRLVWLAARLDRGVG